MTWTREDITEPDRVIKLLNQHLTIDLSPETSLWNTHFPGATAKHKATSSLTKQGCQARARERKAQRSRSCSHGNCIFAGRQFTAEQLQPLSSGDITSWLSLQPVQAASFCRSSLDCLISTICLFYSPIPLSSEPPVSYPGGTGCPDWTRKECHIC